MGGYFVFLNFYMMNKQLLKRAQQKRKVRNIITVNDYNLPMEDYILKIYDTCTPNKYGDSFPTKIQHDIGAGLNTMQRSMDRGDLHINYKKYFEAKMSYIDMKGNYSITNIRDWQLLDYFILCFVNEEFVATYYCVPKNVIVDNHRIHLTGMNNSSVINSFNKYVGKRTTINSNDIEWLFKKSNVLKGTTYKHLTNFLKTQINKLKK